MKPNAVLLCLLNFIFVILITFLTISCNKEIEYNGFTLRNLNGESYVITSYNGNNSEITLPFDYEGTKVYWVIPDKQITNIERVIILNDSVIIDNDAFDYVEIVAKNEVITDKLLNQNASYFMIVDKTSICHLCL